MTEKQMDKILDGLNIKVKMSSGLEPLMKYMKDYDNNNPDNLDKAYNEGMNRLHQHKIDKKSYNKKKRILETLGYENI